MVLLAAWIMLPLLRTGEAFVHFNRETDSLWGSFGSYATPFCGDLDGDGDFDCVVGRYDGTVTFMERIGQSYYSFNSFPDLFAHSVGNHACPFCGDLDGDGRLDCLVGASDGNVAYLRKDALRWALVTSSIFPDVGSNACPFCFDVNDDGLMDCIVGQANGNVSLMLRNPGTPMTFTMASTSFFGRDFGSSSKPSCMRLESGGWDCFVGNSAGYVAYLRLSSLGVWYEETSNVLNRDLGSNAAPHCVDLDGDGLVECAVGLSSGIVQLFTQNQTRDFVLTGTVFSDVGSYAVPTCFETEDDEYFMNCMVGESGGTLQLFRSNLTSPFLLNSSNVLGASVPGGYASPTCIDLEGDGILDLLVGTGNGLVEQHRLTRNDGWVQANGNFFLVDVGERAHPFCVDMDGDGDADCLVGSAAGVVHYFEQTSPLTFVRVSQNFFGVQVSGPARPACVDLDFDGRLECMVGGYNGLVVLFRNIGGAGEFHWVAATSNLFDYDFDYDATPFCMDWGRDRSINCLVGNSNGVTTHMQQGDPTGPRWYTREVRSHFSDVGSYAAPMCTDLYGEGRVGCLIGNEAGYVYYFSRSDSGAAAMDGFTLNSTNLLGVDVGSYAAPFCYDTDGDGDQDCLVGTSDGMVDHFVNIASTWTRSSTNFFSDDVGSYARPCCADFDNDGDIDCLVGESAGMVVYFRNDGGAWTSVTRDFFQRDVGNYAAPACSDMDGDGDLDCLVGNGDGETAYFRNDGTVSEPSWVFADANYLQDLGSFASPFCRDFDEDGDVDCVLGDYNGGVVTFINHRNWSMGFVRSAFGFGLCPVGSHRNGDECERCAAGRHANGGSCTTCPEGTYSDGGVSPCLQLLSDWLDKNAGAESFSISTSHDSTGVVKIQLTVPTLPRATQLHGNASLLYRADMQPTSDDLRLNSSCGVPANWHYEAPVVEISFPGNQLPSSCSLHQSIEGGRVMLRGSVALFLVNSDAGSAPRQKEWPIEINFTTEVSAKLRLGVLQRATMQRLVHTVDGFAVNLQLYRPDFVQPVNVPVFTEGEDIHVQCDALLTQAWKVIVLRAWLTSGISGTPVVVANISDTLEPIEAPISKARFKFVAVVCEECTIHVLVQVQPVRRLREVPDGRRLQDVGPTQGRLSFQIFRDSTDRLMGYFDLAVMDPVSFVEDPLVRTAAVSTVQALTKEPQVVITLMALPRHQPGEANVRAVYNIIEPLAATSTADTLASATVEDLSSLVCAGLQEMGVTGAVLPHVTRHQPPGASLAAAGPDGLEERPVDNALPTVWAVVVLLSACAFGSFCALTCSWTRRFSWTEQPNMKEGTAVGRSESSRRGAAH